MLPMLFTICGTAQACAGVRACEQALGVLPAEGVEAVRESLVRMEILREHLWRILLDWPVFLAESPENGGMVEMLALQRDYRQALTDGRDPFLQPGPDRGYSVDMPQALIEKVALVLGQAVFDMSPRDWLDINCAETLSKWAVSGTTVAARLIDLVLQNGWSALGDCPVEALPFLEEGHLHQVLQDDDFVVRPQWFGNCRETTCLTRVESTLLQELQSIHGNGLLVRLVARLTEIAQLSLKMASPTEQEAAPSVAIVQNPGVGQIAAARGQLLHRVQVDDGRISSYQILAPTEWNFHPEGVVARSLAGIQGDREQMESQARLLINAIDPCVGYELSID